MWFAADATANSFDVKRYPAFALQVGKDSEQVRRCRVTVNAKHAHQALFRCTRALAQGGVAESALDNVANEIASNGQIVRKQRLHGFLKKPTREFPITPHPRLCDFANRLA
jgi:hypothetical protein